MPLTVSLTISQIIGLPNKFTIADTSTGSDVAVTGRRVYLQKDDGTYLVPTGTLTDYIVWPYADATILIDLLDSDMALKIRVDWINVGGTALYTLTIPSVFTLYMEEFDYSLASSQLANPNKVNNTNYYINRIKLRVAINDAKNAITTASSIADSQEACDRGMYLVNNSSVFF